MIQTAINNAAKNDTLMLNGTCQLTSPVFITKSNLTLTGAGAAGSWSSLLYRANASSPRGVAFVIGDGFGNSVISNVTISNLKFVLFAAAVTVDPNVNQRADSCTTKIGSGSATNVIVEDNFFYENARSVENFGTSQNLKIRNNLSDSGSGSFNMILRAKSITCLNDAGQQILIGGLGTPTNGSISGNTFLPRPTSCPAIFAAAVESLDISNNTIATWYPGGGVFQIDLINSQNSRVVKNTIDGTAAPSGSEPVAFNGLDVPQSLEPFFLPSNNNLVADNVFIKNAIGVFINAAGGHSVVNNRFVNSTDVDVFLTPDFGYGPSHDNKVITTNFSNTVIDEGVNNRLLGTQKLLNNPNIPQSLKDAKILNGAGRPTPME